MAKSPAEIEAEYKAIATEYLRALLSCGLITDYKINSVGWDEDTNITTVRATITPPYAPHKMEIHLTI